MFVLSVVVVHGFTVCGPAISCHSGEEAVSSYLRGAEGQREEEERSVRKKGREGGKEEVWVRYRCTPSKVHALTCFLYIG